MFPCRAPGPPSVSGARIPVKCWRRFCSREKQALMGAPGGRWRNEPYVRYYRGSPQTREEFPLTWPMALMTRRAAQGSGWVLRVRSRPRASGGGEGLSSARKEASTSPHVLPPRTCHHLVTFLQSRRPGCGTWPINLLEQIPRWLDHTPGAADVSAAHMKWKFRANIHALLSTVHINVLSSYALAPGRAAGDMELLVQFSSTEVPLLHKDAWGELRKL